MKKIIFVCVIFIPGILFSQELTLQQAILDALRLNPSIQASRHELDARKQIQRSSFDLPKTDVMLIYGQYNSYSKNDNNITVTQSIPFAVLGSQGAMNRAMVRSSELQNVVAENDIVYQVKQVYYNLMLSNEIYALYQRQDSIYEGFAKAAAARYRTGESTLLEHTTADAQRNEGIIQLRRNRAEAFKLQYQLKMLIGSPSLPEVSGTALTQLPFDLAVDSAAYNSNPGLLLNQQQIEIANREKKLQSAKMAPDLIVGAFSQTLTGVVNEDNGDVASGSDRFTGFQIGLSIPLWFKPHQARVKAAEYSKRAAESNLRYYEQTVQGQVGQVLHEIGMHKSTLQYYQDATLPNAERILGQSQISFRAGEIDFAEYLLEIRNAITIKENYLRTLNDYNQSIIYYEYLIGKK